MFWCRDILFSQNVSTIPIIRIIGEYIGQYTTAGSIFTNAIPTIHLL
jgi:hypothetical protein